MSDNSSAGWAVVVGAIVGASTPFLTIFLTHWLQNRRTTSLDDKRRDRLKKMLSGKKYKWRSMEVLSAAIGADPATTAELLIEIDARASLSNSNSWALISRAPWPEDDQPTN